MIKLVIDTSDTSSKIAVEVGESDLDEAILRHLDALASPPGAGECELFESLLDLQPILIPRLDASTSRPNDCHSNVARFVEAKPLGRFTPAFGWADVGSYMVLHTVASAPDWPAGERHACLTPSFLDWMVFRPDPSLRLIRPWSFERDGIEMPVLVRRDPEALALEARRLQSELRSGTCRGWADNPLIAGDPRGAEPERVQEWVRYHTERGVQQ